MTVRITVHYTRISPKPFEYDADSSLSELLLVAGRPNIARALDNLITSTLSNNASPSGVAVAVCGPTALADDVSNVVRRIDFSKQRAVGGVELHAE